ncbi:MAG: carboxypeptidase regulatory-like domain-containing protein [Pyrinomonadaceae bacterium]|nr:carboxypeptidase regulatory-like domain-containing protein [Pyrinomonadaceae bacterium]
MKSKRGFRLRSNGNLVSLIALVLLLLSGAAPARSQNSYRNTITGFIFDSQRTPVTQIPVEITNEVGQVLGRTKTDGSGRYFFPGLSSGRFTIRVLPFGTDLEEQSGDVEIINMSRPGGGSTSDSAQKDFYLRSRRSANNAKSVTGTVFAQDVPAAAVKLYEQGVVELTEKRTDAGMDLLLKAVKIFPDYFLALERLGREYISQQKYDYASAAFLKTVSVNDRSFNGWYGLSYASYALKDPKTGVPAGQKATELNSSSVDAFLILGLAHRQAKQYKEAEKSLLQAKKLANGTQPDVFWNLALLYANDMSRFKDAADELELYLKVSTDEKKNESVRKLIADFRRRSTT